MIDDVAVATLMQANPAIEHLNLYANSHLSDLPFTQPLKCTSLRFLDCTGLNSPGLTDSTLLALGAHCPCLEHLVLSWVTKVTDQGASAVALGCPLSLFSLHGNRNISESTLMALERGCAETLSALDVRGCIGIPDGCREEDVLKRRFPLLQVFIIHT